MHPCTHCQLIVLLPTSPYQHAGQRVSIQQYSHNISRIEMWMADKKYLLPGASLSTCHDSNSWRT